MDIGEPLIKTVTLPKPRPLVLPVPNWPKPKERPIEVPNWPVRVPERVEVVR